MSVDKIIPARNSAAGHAMHRRRPSRLQIFFRFSRPHVKPTTDVITTNLPPPLPLPPFPRARATSYRFSRTVLAITTHTTSSFHYERVLRLLEDFSCVRKYGQGSSAKRSRKKCTSYERREEEEEKHRQKKRKRERERERRKKGSK